MQMPYSVIEKTVTPYSVIEKTVKTLNARRKTISGAKVLVLGIASQSDIADLRESPALTIIELLRRRGAEVAYNDPYLPFLGHGRHYDLNLTCASLDHLGRYDCVLILADHSGYDYARIARESRLVIDTSNATRDISYPNVVHC
jgi:UDP-N-acetyl-D-glucosamine dehydrogenase